MCTNVSLPYTNVFFRRKLVNYGTHGSVTGGIFLCGVIRLLPGGICKIVISIRCCFFSFSLGKASHLRFWLIKLVYWTLSTWFRLFVGAAMLQ